ncbi:MAG: cyclic nucleotide-binding domain-containing protein [Nocardioidaceae bacterium]|nr:cyclic nucleotide-binding domain-containing protein [Nocardioidaceae bacterium]
MRSTGPVPGPDRAAVDDAVRRLRELGTFPGASEADLRGIVSAGRIVTVPSGWSLIWDKTPADKAYVILAGSVEVRRGTEVVATLHAGDVIGELAILHRKLRSASVTAASALTVLHFEREAVERLYDEVPAVREALDATAAERS